PPSYTSRMGGDGLARNSRERPSQLERFEKTQATERHARRAVIRGKAGGCLPHARFPRVLLRRPDSLRFATTFLAHSSLTVQEGIVVISKHLRELGILSTAELLARNLEFEWVRIAERYGNIIRVRKGW